MNIIVLPRKNSSMPAVDRTQLTEKLNLKKFLEQNKRFQVTSSSYLLKMWVLHAEGKAKTLLVVPEDSQRLSLISSSTPLQKLHPQVELVHPDLHWQLKGILKGLINLDLILMMCSDTHKGPILAWNVKPIKEKWPQSCADQDMDFFFFNFFFFRK